MNAARSLVGRRSLLAAAGMLPAALARAAGDYPAQDIKFIIPYGAGGGFDLFVRALTPGMQKRLPKPVRIVPDNVAAGGGLIGAGQLFRARPDGYTIGILNIPGMFVLQQSGGGIDLRRLSWIGGTARDSYAIAVSAQSPLKSIDDLRALSHDRPVKFTTTGREGTAYSALVIGMNLLGVRIQVIAGYKGSSDYVVAAMRGDGDAVVADLSVLRQMVAGGLMRVLATFETHASFAGAEDATSLGLPDLTEIALQRVVAGPPMLPASTVAVLSSALTGALTEPDIVSLALRTGSVLQPTTPEEAVAMIGRQAAFYDKWKSLLTTD